jgi:hypothetical protein
MIFWLVISEAKPDWKDIKGDHHFSKLPRRYLIINTHIHLTVNSRTLNQLRNYPIP